MSRAGPNGQPPPPPPPETFEADPEHGHVPDRYRRRERGHVSPDETSTTSNSTSLSGATTTTISTQDDTRGILRGKNAPGRTNHDRSGSQYHNQADTMNNKKQQAASTRSEQSTKLLLALFLIGIIVCVMATCCILMLPKLVSNQIAKKLVLKNNSMLLERWSKPNVPMYFKVWLYDIKNAQEIVDKRDTKPRVEEIGPFVFNLRRQKDVISFAGDNLYYTERKIYHFNRELSCCAINTTVTIPNIPLVAVVDRALGYNLPLVGRFIPRLINRAIQSLREQLFVRKQVREILFEGYDVELLRMVSRVGSLVGLPQQSQKFALLKGRNDTWRPEQDGVWAINTGQRDRRQFGRVASWNSYKRLPFWSESQCNVINGSDGTLFPPPIKRTEPLYIFNQELCRTVNLVYDRPSDVRSIKALRFVLNPMNFAHTVTGSSSAQASLAPQMAVSGLAAAAGSSLSADPASTPSQQRPRLNPLFQNQAPPSSRLELPNNSPNSGGETSAVRGPDPISILLPAPPFLINPVRSFSTTTTTTRRPNGGQNNGSTRRLASSPASSSSSLMTSASEAQAQRSLETSKPPVMLPATANLLETTSNKDQAHAEIRSQQEKLIRVAQEAQVANERKSKMNPQTCFCDRKTTNLNGVNVCEFDGLIDLSKCSKQAQVIFGSMPHFYNSDPRLLHQVVGLRPNGTKHTTYLDIEPNTGLVLGGKRRVQLNLIIKHNNEIDGFENINDMLVPIVWFEESAQIPEETAQKFRSIYIDKIRMVYLILYSLLVAAFALLAVDLRLLITSRRWRGFKLIRLSHPNSYHGGGEEGGPREQIVSKQAAARRQRKPATMITRSADQPSAPHRKNSSVPLVMPQISISKQLVSGRGSNLPLLISPSSYGRASSTTPDSSPNASPNASPPDSPEGSPELRKWIPNGARQTMRIYLNPNKQHQQLPAADKIARQATFRIDSNNKSIIELHGSGSNEGAAL